MSRFCSALASVRPEFSDWYTDGCACLAVVTMRTVDKTAAATKSLVYQLAVKMGINLVAGACHLRACQAAIDITAWVNRCGEILNLIERVRRAVCHAAGFSAARSCQYTGAKDHSGPVWAVKYCNGQTNVFLAISRAPSDARCLVFCWQSIRGI